MQTWVYGDMISVKRLKEILAEIDENKFLVVDSRRNLAIMNTMYDPSGLFIDVYAEDISNYDSLEKINENRKGNN